MTSLKYMLFALLVFVMDQATKLLVINSLELGGERKMAPVFTLVHWQNRGGLWGFLGSAPEGVTFWVFLILPLAGLALLSYFFIATKDRWEKFLISLILGGALGNILDRMVHGAVTDFLYFHLPDGPGWPAFNVADACISTALTLLMARVLFAGEKKHAPDPV